jgi:uncharacterized membrane protein YebE (DUF533 family)
MKIIKALFTSLVITLSFNTTAQLPDPIVMELELQKYEIDNTNQRLNKSLTLISEAGRQKNIALAIGVGGGLISTLMMVKGKTESTRTTGLVIGGLSLAGTLYLTIESNKKLSQVEGMRL